jgi:hypothetical protein
LKKTGTISGVGDSTKYYRFFAVLTHCNEGSVHYERNINNNVRITQPNINIALTSPQVAGLKIQDSSRLGTTGYSASSRLSSDLVLSASLNALQTRVILTHDTQFTFSLVLNSNMLALLFKQRRQLLLNLHWLK